MKQICILAFLLILISSCSKATVSSNKIQGVWFIKSSSLNGVAIMNPYENADYGNDYKTFYVFEKAKNKKGVLSFRERIIERNPFYGIQIQSFTNSIGNYTISKDGEEVLFQYYSKSINFDIDKLNSDELELRSNNQTDEILIVFEKEDD